MLYAFCLSLSSSDFQNRRRERRTYQLESRSTYISMASDARSMRQLSKSLVTERTSAFNSEIAHRSSSFVPSP